MNYGQTNNYSAPVAPTPYAYQQINPTPFQTFHPFNQYMPSQQQMFHPLQPFHQPFPPHHPPPPPQFSPHLQQNTFVNHAFPSVPPANAFPYLQSATPEIKQQEPKHKQLPSWLKDALDEKMRKNNEKDKGLAATVGL